MTTSANAAVTIQTSAHSAPSPPVWFGELTVLAQCLHQQGVLAAICKHVRFVRRRFGRYEVIDFIAVLFEYAVSGERALETFYERLHPFAAAFMTLFGRDRLPSRSALSRWLAALDQAAVEFLRSLFLSDLLARRLTEEEPLGGLWDRMRSQWLVFDVDGTREAARQRALPQTPDWPEASRRLRPLCAPGYLGRKRGEVVRTRTTVLQAHTHQWLGTFGNPGNGEYRAELRRAVSAIQSYVQRHQCWTTIGIAPAILIDVQQSVLGGACYPAPGWAIWDQSRPLGAGWFLLCAARQRLRLVGSHGDPEPLAPASRSVVQPS